MEFLSFMLKGNYKRFYDNLKKIAEKENKSASLMFIDAALSTLIFGSGLSDYLNYKFYNRTLKEKSKYVTIRYGSNFYKKYSPRKYANNLSDKGNFHKNYGEFTKRDFFIHEFGIDKLNEFLSNHEVFMIKPITGLAGSEVSKMNRDEVKSVQEFYEYIKDNNMLLEEYIVQDEHWSRLCPTSVNTIRAMTRIVNDKPELFYAAARIGNGKAHVDNFHQGGVGVSIDMKNGKLKGNAISKDLEESSHHPLTGVKFDGFAIPYWNEVESLVCKAAMININIKVVGWDVAISNKGPLLVEANRRPGFDLVQVLEDKGTKYMLEEVIKSTTT